MFKPILLDFEEESAKITKYGKNFLMDFPNYQYHPSIIHLQGSPFEMGYSYGYLLADRIQEFLSVYGTPVAAIFGGWNIESGKVPKLRQVNKGIERISFFINRFQMPAIETQAPELLEEMKGIFEGVKARGSKITWEHLCALNCSPEPQYVAQYLGGGCSSFSAWNTATKDGTLIHAANLDETHFDYLHKAQIVMVCKPENGNSFVGVAALGSLNPPRWLNDKFLSFSEMTSISSNMNWPQIPGNMVRRMICQHASSLSEVYNILKNYGGSTGWNNMICEGKGSDPHGIVIEVSGTEIAQREADPEFPDVIWSTNYYNCYPGWQGYEGHNMVPGQIMAFQKLGQNLFVVNQEKIESWEEVDTIEKWRKKIKCPRYEKYRELLEKNFGNLDLKIASEIQSVYEMTLGQVEPIGQTEIKRIQICPPFEDIFGNVRPVIMEECPSTNSTLFIPSKREIWVAAGAVPAQNGPYWKISLLKHLEMLEKQA